MGHFLCWVYMKYVKYTHILPIALFLCLHLSAVADDRKLYIANNSKSNPRFVFVSMQLCNWIWCFFWYLRLSNCDVLSLHLCVLVCANVEMGWMCQFSHWHTCFYDITQSLTGTICECRVAYCLDCTLQPFLSLAPSQSDSEQWISVGLTVKQTGLLLGWHCDSNRPP